MQRLYFRSSSRSKLKRVYVAVANKTCLQLFVGWCERLEGVDIGLWKDIAIGGDGITDVCSDIKNHLYRCGFQHQALDFEIANIEILAMQFQAILHSRHYILQNCPSPLVLPSGRRSPAA